MANHVPGRSSRPRRKRQPRARRRVELVALTQTTRCGAPKRSSGLGSLFRIGLLAALLLAPILFAAGTLAGTVTLDPPPDSVYWTRHSTQAGGNPLHSGQTDVDLASGVLAEQWRRSGFEPFLAGPVMDRENVYVVDRNGTVAALNVTTGENTWTFDAKSTVSATPALAYGWLYVATEGKSLIALSARTGTEIASTTLTGAAKVSPVVAEGRVFQGSDAGILQVFDATTPDEIWKFDTKTTTFTDGKVNGTDDGPGKPIRAAPAVFDGRVYVAGWNMRVAALSTSGNNHGNPETLYWARTVDDHVSAAPVVDRHRNHLLVATAGGQLEAMRLDDGNQVWKVDAGGSFHRGVSVSQARVIAATSDGRLLSVDAYGGAVEWERVHEPGYIAAPVLTNTAIVTMAANGTLQLASPGSGQPLKHAGRTMSWQLPSGSHATPAVTDRGIVAVDQSGVVALWGPPVPRIADLVADTIGTPANLSADTSLSIKAPVTNRGPDASGPMTLVWTLDDGTTGTTTIEDITSGATHAAGLVLPPLESGTHTLTVTFTSDANDPTPGNAETQLQLVIPGIGGADADAGSASESHTGHDDPTTDEDGVVAGFLAAWSGWMLPVSLITAAGGVAGMRNRDRIASLVGRVIPRRAGE